jgi:hypothetical protein
VRNEKQQHTRTGRRVLARSGRNEKKKRSKFDLIQQLGTSSPRRKKKGIQTADAHQTHNVS